MSKHTQEQLDYFLLNRTTLAELSTTTNKEKKYYVESLRCELGMSKRSKRKFLNFI
jgi:hypothetical protein